MKNILGQIIWGKSNKLNGLTAIIVVGLIVLGCTCNKNFKLDSDNSSSSNNSTSNTGDSPFSKENPFANKSKDTTSNKTTTTNPEERTNIPKDSGNDILTNGQLQPLIKNTILDFADAIDNEDFTDFHSKCSKSFRQQFTAERMKTEFNVFIVNKSRAVPILNQVSSQEAIMGDSKVTPKGGGNELLAIGSFPTSPNITSFTLRYLLEGGEWKIVEIRVAIK